MLLLKEKKRVKETNKLILFIFLGSIKYIWLSNLIEKNIEFVM